MLKCNSAKSLRSFQQTVIRLEEWHGNDYKRWKKCYEDVGCGKCEIRDYEHVLLPQTKR